MVDDWDEETTSTAIDVNEMRERHERNKRACLTVLTGTMSGQLYKLQVGNTIIGRAQNAEIRLLDDGVSRHHARVRLESDGPYLEDLESRNGTYVNGARIDGARKLEDGDKIQVGRITVVRFAYHDDLDESFHENLLSSALRDPLTKLFNKRYFLDRLDSELKFAKRHDTALSLLLVDLDHFKAVNDTHGHLAGDAILANLASVLQRAVRNEDVVARFGGEEIAIILRAIPLEPAFLLADRLRDLMEQTVTEHNGLQLRATASIGAAGYPTTKAETIEALIEAADKALYKAKGHGRNRVARPTLQPKTAP
ncbi:MAG: GGDEF domain-containing protein [Kofleriaceae bacterium]